VSYFAELHDISIQYSRAPMKLSYLEEKHNYMTRFENITKCHFNHGKLL